MSRTSRPSQVRVRSPRGRGDARAPRNGRLSLRLNPGLNPDNRRPPSGQLYVWKASSDAQAREVFIRQRKGTRAYGICVIRPKELADV